MNNPMKMHNSIARTACEVRGKHAFNQMVETNNQKIGI